MTGHTLRCWIKKYRPDALLTAIAGMTELLENQCYRVPADIGLATVSVRDEHVDPASIRTPRKSARSPRTP